jgi:hypothetical protein
VANPIEALTFSITKICPVEAGLGSVAAQPVGPKPPPAPADTGVNDDKAGSPVAVTGKGPVFPRFTVGVPLIPTFQEPLCAAFTEGVPEMATGPLTVALILPVTGNGVFATVTEGREDDAAEAGWL